MPAIEPTGTRPAAPGITHIPYTGGDVLYGGPIKMRILEDGSRTDNRIGSISFTLGPQVKGPPLHFHEMHDETFLVTKGRMRFTTGETNVDAETGDYIIVPPRAHHTFTNPFDEEAEFLCTFTPAYYVDYFRILDRLTKERGILEEKDVRRAMARFATIQLGTEEAEAML